MNKVYVVKNYFTHNKRSFYPGETFSRDALTDRGVEDEHLAHHLRRDNLGETETVQGAGTDALATLSLISEIANPPEPVTKPADPVVEAPDAEAPEPPAEAPEPAAEAPKQDE